MIVMENTNYTYFAEEIGYVAGILDTNGEMTIGRSGDHYHARIRIFLKNERLARWLMGYTGGRLRQQSGSWVIDVASRAQVNILLHSVMAMFKVRRERAKIITDFIKGDISGKDAYEAVRQLA